MLLGSWRRNVGDGCYAKLPMAAVAVPPADDPPSHLGGGGAPTTAYTIKTVAHNANNGNNDIQNLVEIQNLNNPYYLAHMLGAHPERVEVRRMALVARPTDTPSAWHTPSQMVDHLGQWIAVKRIKASCANGTVLIGDRKQPRSLC